jgi:hypothetical protein
MIAYFSQFYCHCDQTPEKKIKEGKIYFAYSFRGLIHHGKKAWWSNSYYIEQETELNSNKKVNTRHKPQGHILRVPSDLPFPTRTHLPHISHLLIVYSNSDSIKGLKYSLGSNLVARS